VLSWAQHWRHLGRLIDVVSRSGSIVSQHVCAFISSRDMFELVQYFLVQQDCLGGLKQSCSSTKLAKLRSIHHILTYVWLFLVKFVWIQEKMSYILVKFVLKQSLPSQLSKVVFFLERKWLLRTHISWRGQPFDLFWRQTDKPNWEYLLC
jgi:hypothetical protein